MQQRQQQQQQQPGECTVEGMHEVRVVVTYGEGSGVDGGSPGRSGRQGSVYGPISPPSIDFLCRERQDE